MRRVLISLVVATAASLALSAAASADTKTTDFEGFSLGSVDEQFGWHSAEPSDIPSLPNGYDQEVVDNATFPPTNIVGFGDQSLRHSNAYDDDGAGGVEFQFQTYSASNAQNASEDDPTNTVFTGEFEFSSTDLQEQPGLKMRVSPDDGVGGRMSFVSFTDTPNGIQAQVADTPDPDAPAAEMFRVLTVPGFYSRDEVHTVKFSIELVPGEDNDIVRIFIDDEDIGDKLGVCLETWENYYRNVELEEPPVTNSLGFRSDNGGTDIPSLAGGGYLFDNVVTTTAAEGGPAPTLCGAEGQIAPTGTTCGQYAAGTAPVLGEVQYTTRGGKINAVSPGVFFYYTKVSDGIEGQTVDITEDPGTAPDIPIQQRQVVLYDASSCKVLKWKQLTLGPDVGEATGTLPSGGNFIVGVKYNPSALKGQTAPASPPVTYSFGTELADAVIDGATIDLVKK